MSKIVKNTTGSNYVISDTGVTINASSQYTIPPNDYLLWAASNDVIVGIGSGDLVINDGSVDLSISDGTDLIKGIFPTSIKVLGGSDATAIGNVGDRLKVDAQVSVQRIKNDLISNKVYSIGESINASSSSLDNPILLFKNPSTSGKVVYFQIITGNCEISNERTTFKVFANPTVTSNGTTLTLVSRNVGNGAPASAIEVYKLPTVSANGDKLATINSGENTSSQFIIEQDYLAIQPGNSVLITAIPKSNNRAQAMTAVWVEE